VKVLKESIPNIDMHILPRVLAQFRDRSSDVLYYPEFITCFAFCSFWFSMDRLIQLNQIRLKQGKSYAA
jgi:hypothetical protein